MDILKEITKEVFERYVPAAKMPERNTSIYGRMAAMLEESYSVLIAELVSPAFEDAIASGTELKDKCLRVVCNDAFLRTARSLDLVLTATGFGIVSTESTAPASRARVDALIEQITINKLFTIGDIITLLTQTEGWGATKQASKAIPNLFYRLQHLRELTSLTTTTQNWQLAIGRAATADILLRSEISEEYMEELLQKERTATLENADIIIVRMCREFMGNYISFFDEAPNKPAIQRIVEQLETYSSSYPTYQNSRLYRKRHGERYHNQKEDPTFFFM